MIQYLFNKDSKKLYKVVNDKTVLMWYTTKQSWGACTTSADDLGYNDYLSTFEVVDERNLEKYL